MSRTPSAMTIVAGVVGCPVRHSLSPTIHNAWLAASGVDGVYVAFSPPDCRFEAFLEGMRGGAVRGVNVTAPFKVAALATADEATAGARRAGAANLLIFEADGRIVADSTDGYGLLSALSASPGGFDPRAGPAVVFGAGGAAKSAVAALVEAGAPRVRVINRTRRRADDLVACFGAMALAVDPDQATRALGDANVIVNATALGLDGGAGPLESFAEAPAAAVVLDMVYHPLRTAFLERAAARGLTTVNGLEMLIAQALPSFERLFGRPAPRIDVRAAVLAHLAKTR